jgi:thiosulfate/3-mercaptopyruvate sulfurtransferase
MAAYTYPTADDLRALYEGKARLTPTDEVIAYCRIGERSSHI